MEALSRKTQYNLNTIVIIKLDILKDFENIGIEFVSYGKANALLSAFKLQLFIAKRD